jgi:hypothetical protein
MGYKDYSSNMNICPRKIIVPIDVGSHAMGYKDYSSNSDICPRRMTVLDHFPPDLPLQSCHYCELKETDHSSNLDICPRRIVVHDTSTICQPGPFSTGLMSIHQ